MKVHNDVTSALRAAENSAQPKPSATAAAKSGGPVEAIGSVKISEATRSLQSAGVGETDAPFDAKRVEEIKAAISAGTFKVNADAVAGKLLDSVSQLLTDKA